MSIYYLLLLLMTLMGASASLFLKKSTDSNGLSGLVRNINLYIGAVLYLISAILNIYILKYLEYSVVLPLTSITYIWTMLFSYFILSERITLKKVIGVILITMGAIIISI